MKPIACDKPESMLTVSPGIEAGVPIDAINAACARADAVLQLLQANLESADVRCSDGVILAALWDVQGTLGLIKTLAQHGYASTHQSLRSKAPRTKPTHDWLGETQAASVRARR